jgi:hypothetical protein
MTFLHVGEAVMSLAENSPWAEGSHTTLWVRMDLRYV